MHRLTKISASLIISLCVLSMLVLVIPKQEVSITDSPSYFIISSWDFPDEYNQGIEGFRFYENSTGSWVAAPYYIGDLQYYFLNYYDTGYIINWTAGVSMKLRVYSNLNKDLTGVSSTAEGQNYCKHNISVQDNTRNIIFEKQNFTYYDVEYVTGSIYYYEYDVILNFIPIGGETYTMTIVYEVCYV